MPVILRSPDDLPAAESWDRWLAVTETEAALPPARRLADLPRRLQTCFDGIRDDWLAVARELGGDPAGALSHTATAAAYINDFGLMLAWSALVDTLAEERDRTMVVCSDPWLFRHLAGGEAIAAGKPPPLWRAAARLRLRGLAARLWLAIRLARCALELRSTRAAAKPGAGAIVAYGHPQSDADGHDAYFGELMREIPDLGRALHTDCRTARARELCRDGRSFSLHGFAHPAFALRLVFLRWRLPARLAGRDDAWLLKRAVAHENGGGALAATRWQIHCQERWLRRARPRAVAWPWENHPWERALVRAARRAGVATTGYQHAVVGRHQFNFSPRSNPDGAASLPDAILCNGAAYRDELAALGHDAARLGIGGAFRIRADGTAFHDPDGPVYVALSAIRPIARQMLDAVAAAEAERFEVKDHPLYPVEFAESGKVRRTPRTIPESGGLRAVLYSTGTTGLEGLLAGVPTIRFLPDDRVAPDILPEGVTVPECTAGELADALARAAAPVRVAWPDIMAPVNLAVWRAALAPGEAASSCAGTRA